MTFKETFEHCLFKKFCSCQGRASRSEFWWFMLIFHLLLLVCVFLPLGAVLSILLMIPSVCVTARRLHDIGWSGWWQLFPWVCYIAGCFEPLLFFVGFGFFLYYGFAKGTRYGEDNPYGVLPDDLLQYSYAVRADFENVCRYCGTAYKDGDAYCKECGKTLASELPCPQCGMLHPVGTKFCSSCGRKLEE